MFNYAFHYIYNSIIKPPRKSFRLMGSCVLLLQIFLDRSLLTKKQFYLGCKNDLNSRPELERRDHSRTMQFDFEIFVWCNAALSTSQEKTFSIQSCIQHTNMPSCACAVQTKHADLPIKYEAMLQFIYKPNIYTYANYILMNKSTSLMFLVHL